MGKFFWGSKFIRQTFTLSVVSMILVSCVPGVGKNVRTRVAASTNGSSVVGINQGRVLLDNPIILSKNPNLSASEDLAKYLSPAVLITTNSFLEGNENCLGPLHCFQVSEVSSAPSALQTPDGKWGFQVQTEEFLQVNTFYHLKKLFDQYFENLNLSFNMFKPDSTSAEGKDSALPSAIVVGGQYKLSNSILNAFTNCDEENNAYYEQSTESLCFGYSGTNKKVRWAHDSTIIYHEAGHYFQKVQLNMRNYGVSDELKKAQLGNHMYTEAGSLGEGLADFYSYYVNGRSHWGEWAAGLVKSSRPMSESDALHAPGISTSEDQRLSYPDYLTYNPNAASIPVEDIHMSGMIISHYLVALTQDIETKCSMANKDAREFVMYILNETFAELGDLSSVGTEKGSAGKVNMSSALATTWLYKNNPINYRSFTQTIAKNLLNTIGNPVLGRCNGSDYNQDYIETLLDSYGLLLFKSYNEHRNLTGDPTYTGSSTYKTNTATKAINRKKSVLISKTNIMLDPTSGASSAFVIDGKKQIADRLATMKYEGFPLAISPEHEGAPYNNGNSKVSPGEVVAIALNLYNNSNSTMGGIEVLANDWDHADVSTGAPCIMSSASNATDSWPQAAEGGVSGGTCDAISETTSAPVCFVQLNENNSTRWVSQREFREKMALDTNFCLTKTPAGAATNNDKDCFMKAINGADKATFSKLNPKSNWGMTMANPETGKAYSYDWGNVVMFEVSKHIPPGTVFDCRLRVRFTNCDDCFHDSLRPNNDYKDKDYNGQRPFKLIHLTIPVTD